MKTLRNHGLLEFLFHQNKFIRLSGRWVHIHTYTANIILKHMILLHFPQSGENMIDYYFT